MKVFFIGIHNKPHTQPLCPNTKSGKVISNITEGSPKGFLYVRTNYFDYDNIPPDPAHNHYYDAWMWNHRPDENDLIVLLGKEVQKYFKAHHPNQEKVIELMHPAYPKSKDKITKYIINAARQIKACAAQKRANI